MKDKHIIELLENAPLKNLTQSEIKTVRAHVEDCNECFVAYEAAQVSNILLRERAAETFEPSPFFHTRVMAAIRERGAIEINAFKRFWNNARSLVYSLTAIVLVLFAVTFFSFGLQTEDPQESAFASNQYSAEDVLLTQDDVSDNQLTDDQVFSAIYEP